MSVNVDQQPDANNQECNPSGLEMSILIGITAPRISLAVV